MKLTIILISILYFILFPLNLTFTVTPYGLFLPWFYLMYSLFWLIPIIYLNMKKILNLKKLITLIILNIIMIPVFVYFWEKYADLNQKQIMSKYKERKLQMNNELWK